MRLISKWLFRIKAALFPGRLEEAMKEEMAFHMEMEARKLMASGMPPREAMRKARRDFGEPEYHKEKARENWGIGMIQTFRVDARHTLRTLRRNPIFTFVAVLTLGLGIGATTSIFSVVNGILLRGLPFPEADRLVSLCETMPDEAGTCSTASTPNVADWAQRSGSFETIGVFRWWGHILERTEGAEGVRSLIATPQFFQTMRYTPAVGRLFQPDDQLDGNRFVAVLDHDFWTRRFGGDPEVLGSTISLSGESYRVIGVMGEGQKPPAMAGEPSADIWLPLHFQPRDEEFRDWRGFYAIGRLAPGVTLDVAKQEMMAIHDGLQDEHPEANADWGLQVRSLQDRVVGRVRTTLLFFLGAVALVMLITCANIANLILARAASRDTEFGVRTALGAGRTRLLALLLNEGLVLAILGGGLGLLVAWVGTPVFLSLAPAGIPRLDEVGIDGRVLAFALGLSFLSTLLFGLAPLTRASRVTPMHAIRGGRHGGTAGMLGGANRALVVSEVALALALLVGAGLLIRSFAAFYRWDPGIDRDHLLTVSVSATTGRYQGNDAVLDLYQTLDEHLLGIPGVSSVARSSSGPLFGGVEPDQVYPGREAARNGPGRRARWFDVSPEYFRTMGIPLLEGREFDTGDDGDAPMVVMVNQTLADRLWPGDDPLGKELWLEMHDGSRQVVGVVADVPPLDPDASMEAEMYWPQAQYTRPVTFFILRTEGDPEDIQRLVADRIREVDPDLQVGAAMDYRELVNRRLVEPRFNMFLTLIFAGVALILAAVGIYGVVSRSVAVRTREIGIRVALGAQRMRVVGEVIRSSVTLAALGVLAGLGLSFILSRFIQSLLHGVVPVDPFTYGTVALAIFGVACLASTVPALAASRVDPAESLREE